MAEKKVKVSIFQRPKQGNAFCGDSYFYIETEEQFVCTIADGLGSGELARDSSQAVIDIIEDNINVTVEDLVQKANKVLSGKRGVVLGILKINFQTKIYSFSSIGNIGIMMVSKDRKKTRNIPNSGYLAGYKRTIKVKSSKLEEGTNFIMFSDGVQDKELSQCFFIDPDVEFITNSYEQSADKIRNDDTTLIAMRYEG
jgi:negative regulator of sigma-B (phosphoserine phosphatase)